ncbi:MAG: hypothetical protein HXX09_11835 [Bacteroidetes bacterium]|nr:hypothetical protein [Bacteroidota bacterium]
MNNIASSEWDPSIAAPLIHSKLTLRDVLNDYDNQHLFTEDNTHFLFLVYKNEVFSQRADELITISDQTINTNYNISPAAIPNGDSLTLTHTTTYPFATPAGARYDTLYIKSGMMNFAINSNLNHDAKIRITMPSATKNGIPFSATLIYNYSGSLPVLVNSNFDLSDYKVVFTNVGGQSQITINYAVTIYGDGTGMSPSYTWNMGESLSNLKFSKFIGYFGQQTLNINNDTIPIDIFTHNFSGFYDFVDPKLHFIVDNSYGIPVVVNIGNFKAFSTQNSPYVVTISGSGIPIPWNILYPNFSQMGQSVRTQIDLDKNNSTIKNAIDISPQHLLCQLSGTSNPGGPTAMPNFVCDTSRLRAEIQVELPLWGKAWNFVLIDTIAFELKDVKEIESILFKINIDNGFPIDSRVQLYFTDSTSTVLDSLLNPFQQVVYGAPVGSAPDYKVISPVKKVTETTMGRARLDHLLNVKKMIIKAYINTYDATNTFVKLYSDYNIDVRVGVKAQLKIQI